MSALRSLLPVFEKNRLEPARPASGDGVGR
jgi:hypothetical protein